MGDRHDCIFVPLEDEILRKRLFKRRERLAHVSINVDLQVVLVGRQKGWNWTRTEEVQRIGAVWEGVLGEQIGVHVHCLLDAQGIAVSFVSVLELTKSSTLGFGRVHTDYCWSGPPEL